MERLARVGRSHEGFADEEGVEASVAETGDIDGGVDTAFGDLHNAGRNPRSKVERGVEAYFECV